MVAAAGVEVRVLGTPGHTADSLSFVLARSAPAVLTGDTVLGRGTTVVAHPDGVLAPTWTRCGGCATWARCRCCPAHGPELPDARGDRRGVPGPPRAAAGPGARRAGRARARTPSARAIVELVYADVDQAALAGRRAVGAGPAGLSAQLIE